MGSASSKDSSLAKSLAFSPDSTSSESNAMLGDKWMNKIYFDPEASISDGEKYDDIKDNDLLINLKELIGVNENILKDFQHTNATIIFRPYVSNAQQRWNSNGTAPFRNPEALFGDGTFVFSNEV
ncbi:hypothetical protein DPMN_032457, partial [Dreissena polymorpha]